MYFTETPGLKDGVPHTFARATGPTAGAPVGTDLGRSEKSEEVPALFSFGRGPGDLGLLLWVEKPGGKKCLPRSGMWHEI